MYALALAPNAGSNNRKTTKACTGQEAGVNYNNRQRLLSRRTGTVQSTLDDVSVFTKPTDKNLNSSLLILQ